MIRTITYRKMDEYLRFSEDLVNSREVIDYLRTTNRQMYQDIVEYYCKEACEMNACVHCKLYEEISPKCEKCSNRSFERFYEREGLECLDEYIDTTQKILEIVAVQATWEIAEKAAEVWIRNLSDTDFFRLISNADLSDLLHQALILFDSNREGKIDTSALILARKKVVGEVNFA